MVYIIIATKQRQYDIQQCSILDKNAGDLKQARPAPTIAELSQVTITLTENIFGNLSHFSVLIAGALRERRSKSLGTRLSDLMIESIWQLVNGRVGDWVQVKLNMCRKL